MSGSQNIPFYTKLKDLVIKKLGGKYVESVADETTKEVILQTTWTFTMEDVDAVGNRIEDVLADQILAEIIQYTDGGDVKMVDLTGGGASMHPVSFMPVLSFKLLVND